MHNRAQGDVGEASAIEWLARQGALIFTPLFRSPDYDLVAEMAGRVMRIEVKTSSALTPIGNYAVAVCTRGGNQSWNKIAKRFDRNAAITSSSTWLTGGDGSSLRHG